MSATSWNFFKYCSWMKILGSLMIAVVLSIVGITYYAVIVECYGPAMMQGGEGSRGACAVLAIFHILVGMLLWCYFSCVFTDPGGVSHAWKPAALQDLESGHAFLNPGGAATKVFVSDRLSLENAHGNSLDRLSLETTRGNGLAESSQVLVQGPTSSGDRPRHRYCRKCDVYKPDRCHHCSICSRCVLKMDHHCVWVVNCVGARNYKFFLLFLVYTFLACFVSTCALFPFFLRFFRQEPGAMDPISDVASVFVSFVMNIAFSFSLLGFLVMHGSLVFKNKTTIEMCEKKYDPSVPWKYDQGLLKNVEQVLGTSRLLWPLPLYSAHDKMLMQREDAEYAGHDVATSL
eukprot:jgi/Mesvir1/25051/Mv11896-RA.1